MTQYEYLVLQSMKCWYAAYKAEDRRFKVLWAEKADALEIQAKELTWQEASCVR